MAFDAFIKINGIDGESADAKHSGWIEVMSCDLKVSQNISDTNGSNRSFQIRSSRSPK